MTVHDQQEKQLLKFLEENDITTNVMNTSQNCLKNHKKTETISHEKSYIMTDDKQQDTSASSDNNTKSDNNNMIVSSSRKIADSLSSLEELKQALLDFEGCDIKNIATNTVISDGVPYADTLIIGEAPGEQEDKQGIPFCGRSGQLLDKMLSCINLSRQDNVYITNTVFWRPPNNRRPTVQELEICKPFLEKHISLLKPKIIFLLGSSAVSSVMNSSEPISKIRGKFYKYSNQYLANSIPVLPSFHPSYLLRQSTQKKFAWQDLKTLRAFLDNNYTIPTEQQ